MIKNIQKFLRRHPNVIVFVAFAALSYSLVVVIVSKKLSDLELRLEVQTSDQRTLLNSIAETTARNGADAVTESIVRDCSIDERNDFDKLLSRLNDGLSPTELQSLSRLFDRCGSFYAERKSVMVSRLSREIDVYSSYVDQLKTISSKKTVDSYQVNRWKDLATAEQKQSDAFTNLAVEQGSIIRALGSGKDPKSDEVKNILKNVRELQQKLADSNAEAAAVRSDLIKL